MTALFSDGFESNDFTAWTSTATGGTGTLVVNATRPHHGTYSAYATGTCSGGYGTDYGYATKTITQANIVYARAYFYFNTLTLSQWKALHLIYLEYNNQSNATVVGIYNDGGTLKWNLWGFEADAWFGNLSSVTPTTGVWYCVEVKRDVTNDQNQLWINGVLVSTVNVAMAQGANKVFAGFPGIDATVDDVISLYFDCAVVADAYIGVEEPAEPPSLQVISSGSQRKLLHILDLMYSSPEAEDWLRRVFNPDVFNPEVFW
ncbi:MAG: hypothetical protein WC365_07195 [Candidatus Babeliales bacterium]